MTLISLASFAALARPAGPADNRVISIDPVHQATGQSSALAAARMADGAGISKKVTGADAQKSTPGLGPAYGQVDATLPGPRPSEPAPTTTTTATSQATGSVTTTKAKGAPTSAKAGSAQNTTQAAVAPTTTKAAPTTVPTTAPTTAPATAPTTTKAAVAPTTTPPASPPTGWQTVFVDNFDAAAVDSSKWTVENRPATNMGEISFYAADDVFTRDGNLIVRTQKRPMGGRNYTSGQAVTKFDFKYGRVEIRAKMPKGQGFWPALWMLPTNGSTTGWLPEIDIYESINNENRYFGNYHFPTGSGQSQLGPVPVPTDVTSWHVYGFDWTPQSLTWTLDGQPVVTTTNVAATNQHRMFLLITFALGGAWPGPPNATTPFPSEMQIDYVRVMQQV